MRSWYNEMQGCETTDASKIRSDFDRIALLSGEGWNHNDFYHPYLLKQAAPGAEALEIGCGSGAFSRLLAGRFRRVLALDLSPRMVELAWARSGSYPHVDYRVADATAYDFPPERFDCVASIATLHHLPLAPTLRRMRDSLRSGGTLLVLDLFQAEGPADLAMSLAAAPVSLGLRWLKTGRLREPAEVRAAWEEHGRSDVYPTLAQVRRACAAVLPGARVRRHLLWRYSIVWTKGAKRVPRWVPRRGSTR